METITIPPGITRELDIAFSTYGDYQPGEYEPVRTTGTTTFVKISPSSTKGTFDPNIISTGSRYINNDIGEDEPSLEIRRDPTLIGTWIALHMVLANPTYDSELYLVGTEPPKRYNSIIRVTCNEGQSDETNMILLVTPTPSGLNFDWRITPRNE